MVLSILHGATYERRRHQTNQKMESDPKAYRPSKEKLPQRRFKLQTKTTTSHSALGLRFEKNIKPMKNTKIFTMPFARVYPLYIQKVEKKGRSKEEVDTIICWLTGYSQKELQKQINKLTDFQTFFAEAPQINPNASKITGVICGWRVEEMEDKLMQKIRYLDKLIDELAKGKAMEKILRK